MTDSMHDAIHRATIWPLAIATMVFGAIAAKVGATIDAQAPEGYQDEAGFHPGSPTFKN